MFWYSSYFTINGDVSHCFKGMILAQSVFWYSSFFTDGDVSDCSKGMILNSLCFGTVLTLLMVMYQTFLGV